jgi:hypothetical protein
MWSLENEAKIYYIHLISCTSLENKRSNNILYHIDSYKDLSFPVLYTWSVENEATTYYIAGGYIACRLITERNNNILYCYMILVFENEAIAILY